MVVVEVGVILVGLCLLLARGAWTTLTAPRTRARLARGRAALQSILDDAGGDVGPRGQLTALPRRLQTDVLTGVAPSLAGAQRERLTTLARELGLLAVAEARCGSRLWWRRLQGARLFTLLGGGDATVRSLLDDRRPEVRAQAAQWAAEHHDGAVIDQLLEMLEVDDASTRFTVKDSLIRTGRSLPQALAVHLSGRPDRAGDLGPALEVAVALPDPVLLPAALALCDDEVPHLRALAAALAGAIGGDATLHVLTRMLGDQASEVRAAAARALGRAGQWPAAASLAPLLGDRSWEVRQQAALALRTLGSPGLLFLQHALSARDPFAADAARHMLDLPDSAVRTL